MVVVWWYAKQKERLLSSLGVDSLERSHFLRRWCNPTAASLPSCLPLLPGPAPLPPLLPNAPSAPPISNHRLVDPDTGAEKKSICNKFPQACAVTSLVWPKDRPNEVVFGLADGKVRLGMLKNNKSYTCYAHPENSYVVALASSLNGQNVISGHMDGAIWKFNFPAEEGGTPTSSQLVVHSCVPYSLGWGSCIAAAGNDNRVVFYDLNGREIRSFDYSNNDEVREFTTCAFNPSGDTVVFGTYNRFYMYTFNIQRNDWEEAGHKQVGTSGRVGGGVCKAGGERITDWEQAARVGANKGGRG